ncbi:ATP-binding protein [Halobellus ordinarius]|uniref:ATP-binding protein n=1 Tax=Halobellus ordinarius TaxID=3075120 RepID=UPI0028802FA2|nr:ATP-binding protein [Halobellus sp. ZY16]
MSQRRRRWWAGGSGFVVAGIGFLLTRSTTAASATAESSASFLFGEVPFLVVGLGLSLFGVSMAVSEWGREHGVTVARWCLFGTAATGIAVAASLFGAGIFGAPSGAQTVALGLDILLTGAVGGTVTGIQVSRRRAKGRAVAERNTRLTLLNRILRHEVLNSLNVVRGYAGIVGTDDREPAGGSADGDREATADGGVADAADAIERSADRINEAIEEVNRLTRSGTTGTVDLGALLESCVADAETRYPHAEFELQNNTDDSVAVATDRIEYLFEHLLGNAIEHNDAARPRVRVELDSDWETVSVTVADNGNGLPERQRRVLLDGELPEYDDPGAGFGLTIVRLLATESNADVAVGRGIDGSGVGITLTFRRERTPDGTAVAALGGGVSAGSLGVAAAAATVAGFVMGVPLSLVQGSIPVIGALYGMPSPVAGWTVHMFHSVVFGLGFVALLSTPRLIRYRSESAVAAVLGGLYGTAVWFVAAGFVMPVWLRVIGLPATIPNLELAGLFGHLLWGVTLGAAFAVGRRRLPRYGSGIKKYIRATLHKANNAGHRSDKGA